MNKCIRMGITASNLSFGEVNRRFYGRKLRFTAPLTRRRKTEFPTVKLPIYLPKCQIWKQLSPNSNALAYVTRRLIGQRQKFATVYSAIYCRKSDVIT